MKRRNFLGMLALLIPSGLFAQTINNSSDSVEVISTDTANCKALDNEVYKYTVYETSDGTKYTGSYARQLWLRKFGNRSGYYASKLNRIDSKIVKTKEQIKTKASKSQMEEVEALNDLRKDYIDAWMMTQFCIQDVARLIQKYG